MNTLDMIKSFAVPCPCGRVHETNIKDVRVGSGLVHEVGKILKENGFSKRLLVVADENTMRASEGILESLSDFELEFRKYENLRLPLMEDVEAIMQTVHGRDISILSVGTGCLNDICRVAAAREDKKFCIFATAPSMDGFASYSAPILKNGFKSSYPAKSPEVIIGDTKILAAAPAYLKSAGFGDMLAKYIGIVDWKISTLLTGEYFCDRVANLSLEAVNELLGMADRVTANDEETAGMIFESLLKTGIAMSFTQNSRPASGCEHIISHLMEVLELLENKPINYHGEDVGVCTLKMMEYYAYLASHETIHAHREKVDWDDVYKFYGTMADDVRVLNTPDTITDSVDPADLEAKWGEIRKIIKEMPPYEVCLDAMRRAGCKLTLDDIHVTQEFYDTCLKYSPYMRRRLTLLRLRDMISVEDQPCKKG